MILRTFSYLLLVVVLTLVGGICWLWWLSPGTTPAFDLKKYPTAIAEINYPIINGVEQFVLIRGQERTNPLLLLLHGGPGDAQSAQFATYNQALEEEFVVVNWDQRGAGASYVESNVLSPEQMVADTHAVTEWLKNRFGRSRIFLLGHSWGSFIGLRAAHEQPCNYFAYVGIGQVADQGLSEMLSYKWVLKHAVQTKHQAAIDELVTIGKPNRGWYAGGLDSFYQQRKWVREFGGAAYGLNNRQTLTKFAYPLLMFPSYTIGQKLRYLDAEAESMRQLEKPMLDYDLKAIVRDLELPVVIMQGKYDLQTMTSVTRDYFDALRAPFKEFIEFQNSGHLVPYEEPEIFHKAMVEQVLPFVMVEPSDRCNKVVGE